MKYNGLNYNYLRALTLSVARTYQTKNPLGFLEVGENKQLLIAIVMWRLSKYLYFLLHFYILSNYFYEHTD